MLYYAQRASAGLIIAEATHAMRDPAHQRLYATLLINWVEEMVRASRRSYR